MKPNRVLVHLSEHEQRLIDPSDVYFLAASGHHTEIRLRGRQPLIDNRSLGEVLPAWTPHGIIRIHLQHAVNINRIHTLRRQPDGRDWEVKLEPPVNTVLPIARDRLAEFRTALGG